MSILEQIRDAVIELDIDNISKLCQEAVQSGLSAYRIVIDGMAKGMAEVGKRYEDGEYFLAELIMAGETMKEGMNILKPYFKSAEIMSAGKCIIGTVKGDIHDIGKNVFISLLRAQNYEVVDLGVDVSADQFLEAVKAQRPNILAMSALLTTTMDEMGKVIQAVEKAGIKDSLKIIIGGAPVTEEFAEKIGANAASSDAAKGVKIISNWFNTGSKQVRVPDTC
jgi:5-methyltetrahydrofolate--homocysteine methyltransferase